MLAENEADTLTPCDWLPVATKCHGNLLETCPGGAASRCDEPGKKQLAQY